MTLAIIIIAVLLGLYALIMWLTGDGGPASITDFWNDEDGR